ncbi:MAG: universal stress protein [Acidobacteriota bacterium]
MPDIKKILAPTDFSEPSYTALRQAGDWAKHFKADLSVLYVVPPVPALSPDPNYAFELPRYEEALHSNAEERLREVIDEHLGSGIQAHAMVGYGDAAREIVRIAEKEMIDLIVIATHGLTGWRHLVFGSVAEKVVRLSPSPVLTVRIPDEMRSYE